MDTQNRTFDIGTSTNPAPPAPQSQSLNSSITSINEVLSTTSLESNGGQSARISNLGYANVISSTNQSGQNAISNQQAHSQLALSIVGKTVNRVQSIGASQARSSVDVLTDNATADEIASLKATLQSFGGGNVRPSPSRWKHLLQSIQKLLREIQHINTVNARLQGDGTLENPYRIMDNGPLFLTSHIAIGFPGVSADQVTFVPVGDSVKIGG